MVQYYEVVTVIVTYVEHIGPCIKYHITVDGSVGVLSASAQAPTAAVRP